MRLRNRIVKASFYNDPDLCRWPRDKRNFYQSLWACAEDSCCLEDDMFGVKLAAWPSPHDADLTVELFEQWRDELVADGKLIPYEARGKRYLYIPGMAAHEAPRNPQRPDCDLPPWVDWVPNAKDPRKGAYNFHDPSTCDDVVQALYDDCTSVVQPSPPRPVPSRTVPSFPPDRPSQVGPAPPVDNFQGEEEGIPAPYLRGPDAVTARSFRDLHAAMLAKYGEHPTAQHFPAVLDAIRAECPPDCSAFGCITGCEARAIERVKHTKQIGHLADFIRKELST